ncbi:THAP domain-containing protein 1-like [Neodiprion pinetum]|uniref:THAP domain-containing protein 1-like n=1 Tax=Neodiprion pinetum TaxID=441929 RepID=UPI001EDE83DE|nr:THAP domain-containing protein 1-like [Neodiprion pinetum]
MVRVCCIKGCKNSSDTVCSYSFFVFPYNNEKLKKLWLNSGPGYKTISKYSYICSYHFFPEDYVEHKHTARRTLKKNAVPSIFHDNVPKSAVPQMSNLPNYSFQYDTSPSPPIKYEQSEEDDKKSNKMFCGTAVQTCSQLSGLSVSVQTCTRLSGPSNREQELVRKIKLLQDRLRYKKKRIQRFQDLVTHLKKTGMTKVQSMKQMIAQKRINKQ